MENKKRCFGLDQQWHALLGILSLVAAGGIYYGYVNFLWLAALVGVALLVFAFSGKCCLRSCLCCAPWNKSCGDKGSCDTQAADAGKKDGGCCNH